MKKIQLVASKTKMEGAMMLLVSLCKANPDSYLSVLLISNYEMRRGNHRYITCPIVTAPATKISN